MTHTMYCWLLLQIHLCCLRLLLCSRDTDITKPKKHRTKTKLKTTGTTSPPSHVLCCDSLGERSVRVGEVDVSVGSEQRVQMSRNQLLFELRRLLSQSHRSQALLCAALFSRDLQEHTSTAHKTLTSSVHTHVRQSLPVYVDCF